MEEKQSQRLRLGGKSTKPQNAKSHKVDFVPGTRYVEQTKRLKEPPAPKGSNNVGDG